MALSVDPVLELRSRGRVGYELAALPVTLAEEGDGVGPSLGAC